MCVQSDVRWIRFVRPYLHLDRFGARFYKSYKGFPSTAYLFYLQYTHILYILMQYTQTHTYNEEHTAQSSLLTDQFSRRYLFSKSSVYECVYRDWEWVLYSFMAGMAPTFFHIQYSICSILFYFIQFIFERFYFSKNIKINCLEVFLLLLKKAIETK